MSSDLNDLNLCDVCGKEVVGTNPDDGFSNDICIDCDCNDI